MTIHLEVRITLPNGKTLVVGEIATLDPDQAKGGALRGEFRYSPEWLNFNGAFALDPAHLPLQSPPFPANRPHTGVHGVFEDSLPDNWGRELLNRRYRLKKAEQRVPNLLAMVGGNAMGALSYAHHNTVVENEAEHDYGELEKLYKEALAYQQDKSVDDKKIAALFQAGASPGGARPKVLVDEKSSGQHSGWLVKFPAIKDEINIPRLEAACLKLASDAGMVVPEYQLLNLPQSDLLALKRFDQVKSGGRIHKISFKSLLGVEHHSTIGYADIADIVRQFSAHPQKDLPALYCQMVFNACIGNTDDHLKNFEMLHDDSGWKLSPAYDLLPNISRDIEHNLHFGNAGFSPTISALQDLSSAFGLSKQRGCKIIDSVKKVLSKCDTVFSSFGLDEKETAFYISDIMRRLKK